MPSFQDEILKQFGQGVTDIESERARRKRKPLAAPEKKLFKTDPSGWLSESFTVGAEEIERARSERTHTAAMAERAEMFSIERPKRAPEGEKELTFREKWKEIKEEGPAQFVGFVSGGIEAARAAKIAKKAWKLDRGEATEEERGELLEFAKEQRAKQYTTPGYKILDVVSAMPAFMQEFILTGPAYKVGQKVAMKGITRGLEKYTGKIGAQILEKQVGKVGAKVAAGVAGATLQTPFMGAPRIVSGTIERSMPKLRLSETERGDLEVLIAGKGEDFAPAFLKSVGDQWAETVSEHSGGLFSILGKGAKNAAIKSGLLSSFIKANPNKSPNAVIGTFRKMGYHGVLNEMMEERLGEVLRAGIGVQDYSLPTLEQLGVEMVAFAVPGVVQSMGARAFDKMKAPDKVKKSVLGGITSTYDKDKSSEKFISSVMEGYKGQLLDDTDLDNLSKQYPELKEDLVTAKDYARKEIVKDGLSAAIDEGLSTGEFQGEEFTPEDAMDFIGNGLANDIFTTEDLEGFKEKHPELKTELNSLMADSVAVDMGLDDIIEEPTPLAAPERESAELERVYEKAKKRSEKRQILEEKKKAKEIPKEVAPKVELSTDKIPWKTEERAARALEHGKRFKAAGFTSETHEIVPVEGGFGIARKVGLKIDKPWALSLDQFKREGPEGFKIESLPGEDIARAEPTGIITLDPEKFFGHSVKDRADIIKHEQAHFIEGEMTPDHKARLMDDEMVMGYRGRNINEKLANMIQDGKLPDYVMAKYPKLTERFEEFMPTPKKTIAEPVKVEGGFGIVKKPEVKPEIPKIEKKEPAELEEGEALAGRDEKYGIDVELKKDEKGYTLNESDENIPEYKFTITMAGINKRGVDLSGKKTNFILNSEGDFIPAEQIKQIGSGDSSVIPYKPEPKDRDAVLSLVAKIEFERSQGHREGVARLESQLSKIITGISVTEVLGKKEVKPEIEEKAPEAVIPPTGTFTQQLDAMPIGKKVKIPALPAAPSMEGTWTHFKDMDGEILWKNSRTGALRSSADMEIAREHFDIPGEVEKPKAPKKIAEDKQLHEIKLLDIHKDADVLMSEDMRDLHDHKARVKGFEKAGGSFVEGYIKKLAGVAEKTDPDLAMTAYNVLTLYKDGKITEASLEAEKVLGELHKTEKESFTPDKIAEIHKQAVKDALAEGKTVSKEILEGYPDLVKKPEKVEPEKEPWEMPQKEWVDGHIKSPALHGEHVKRAVAEGRAVPEEVLREYPDLVKKPKEATTHLELLKRYVEETGEKIEKKEELDKVKKKYPVEWAKIEKAEAHKKALWDKLPEDFRYNRGINEYTTEELEKEVAEQVPADILDKKISEGKAVEPKKVAMPAVRGAWHITAEDRPIWIKKGNDITGFRGPYSVLEVTELTGTDESFLKKDGKPVYTLDDPKPEEPTVIVGRALKDNVVDIGQLSETEIRALNKAVKDGILEKAKAGKYPGVRKNVYAKPGFDFEGQREKALEELRGVRVKDPIPDLLTSKKKAKVNYEMTVQVAETGETVTVTKDAGVALRETKEELDKYDKFLACLI